MSDMFVPQLKCDRICYASLKIYGRLRNSLRKTSRCGPCFGLVRQQGATVVEMLALTYQAFTFSTHLKSFAHLVPLRLFSPQFSNDLQLHCAMTNSISMASASASRWHRNCKHCDRKMKYPPDGFLPHHTICYDCDDFLSGKPATEYRCHSCQIELELRLYPAGTLHSQQFVCHGCHPPETLTCSICLRDHKPDVHSHNNLETRELICSQCDNRIKRLDAVARSCALVSFRLYYCRLCTSEMYPPKHDSRPSHSRVCRRCDFIREEKRKRSATPPMKICSVCQWGVDESTIPPDSRFSDACGDCRSLLEGAQGQDPRFWEDRQRCGERRRQWYLRSRPPSYRSVDPQSDSPACASGLEATSPIVDKQGLSGNQHHGRLTRWGRRWIECWMDDM
jgi:hypothetical protein